MADQWETYAEAADRLGMTVEALRHRARRQHWRRQPGNDGKARVLVPDDFEPAARPIEHPAADSANTQPPAAPPPDQSGEIKALQARIEDLAATLAHARNETTAARRETDREREERRQERDRADRLADDLADMARRMADAASSKDETHERMKALEVALDAMKARPWWRRLVG